MNLPQLRVLHLASSFPRWEGDHQAPYLADLVRAQNASGIEALVLAPHGPGLARKDVVGDAPVTRFRYGPGRAEVLAYRGGLMSTIKTPAGATALAPFLTAFAARAARLARSQSVDVIHAHWWLPAGLVALPASSLSGAPVVVTCHGSDVELLRRTLFRRTGRAVLGRARVVAAVSGPLAIEVGELAGVETRVLRMPVTSSDRGAGPAAGSPLLLVAAGRLSREKGFDVAVAAVGQLVDQGIDVRLSVVGDGPERSALERQARPLGDRVVIKGALPRAELQELIGTSHALLAPSRHEGLGLVALEALALGTPVIASEVGGLVEVVRPDDGLLVPPGDADALAQAIRRLPLPRPVGATAEAHRPEAVVAEHRRAYEDALALARRGRHG